MSDRLACRSGSAEASSELGTAPDELIWDEDDHPVVNYTKLGRRLAGCGDLFRRPGYAAGLLLLRDGGEHVSVAKGVDLAPIVVDRVKVRVIKDGKLKGGKLDQAHLNAMLKTEAFLGQFLPVDRVSLVPAYLPNFEITKQGYNDGGTPHRILYTGEEPLITASLDTIHAFLGVMAFENNADRSNTVAAALTVVLRNHWAGEKPIMVVTANKSHAGKDTLIAFATGVGRSVSISYQSTNWAFERSFVGAVNHCPDTSVVVVENARLDRRDRFIASAFLERFATDPEPLLFSTGTGQPLRRRNDLVVAISTNYGSVSEDILNRSLPIHLSPVGNVADRVSPIGNPKLEFLPANRGRIAAELRGIVERWKEAGRPLDEQVRHPFSVWARTIGGILKVSGFDDFLANYGQRKSADDPLRQGLGILGAARPGVWLGPGDWAGLVAELGLIQKVIPPSDQDSAAGRQRGVGVVLSAHGEETFEVETDVERLTLRLDKRRGRWGGEPHVRYRFEVVGRQELPEEPSQASDVS